MVPFLLVTEPPLGLRFEGNGGLDDVLRRYFLLSTGYTHDLFNSEVLELYAGLARTGRNLNAS
jgi:hypothetical protein